MLELALKQPLQVQENIPSYEQNDVVLFEDDTVSTWNNRFMPGYTVPPHDHQMHATIGVYAGAETNVFYDTDINGALQKCGEVAVSAGEVLQITANEIHSVACISTQPCLGIHVYLGKLTTVKRSLFDTRTGQTLAFTQENYNRLTQSSE